MNFNELLQVLPFFYEIFGLAIPVFILRENSNFDFGYFLGDCGKIVLHHYVVIRKI